MTVTFLGMLNRIAKQNDKNKQTKNQKANLKKHTVTLEIKFIL